MSRVPLSFLPLPLYHSFVLVLLSLFTNLLILQLGSPGLSSILLVPGTGLPTTDVPSQTLSSSLVTIFSPFFPLPSDPAVVLNESSEVDHYSMMLFYGREMNHFHDAFDVALKMGQVERIPRLVRRMGELNVSSCSSR